MTPFSVRLHRHDIGKRQCCLKAASAEAARQRVKMRAYPGCTILNVKPMKPDDSLDVLKRKRALARNALTAAHEKRRKKYNERVDDLIALVKREGPMTTYRIIECTGWSYSGTRRYVDTATEQGRLRVTRDVNLKMKIEAV